jgi:AraC-like DNA-binding protein
MVPVAMPPSRPMLPSISLIPKSANESPSTYVLRNRRVIMELRSEHSLSWQTIARNTGVSYATIANYCIEKRPSTRSVSTGRVLSSDWTHWCEIYDATQDPEQRWCDVEALAKRLYPSLQNRGFGVIRRAFKRLSAKKGMKPLKWRNQIRVEDLDETDSLRQDLKALEKQCDEPGFAAAFNKSAQQ